MRGMIWPALFVSIVGGVILIDWLRCVINFDRAPYVEPEGNTFFDTLSANPNRGRYQ